MIFPNTTCTAIRREDSLVVTVDRQQIDSSFYECTALSGTRHVFHESALMPIKTIPSRHREHLFAQVAPHIGAALNAYPDAIIVEPGRLAIDTLRRRMLEAVQAKKLYGWKHPSINEELWHSHIEEISCVIRNDGTLIVGPRPAIKGNNIVGSQRPFTAPQACELTLNDISEIETVCGLLHRRVLSPVPVVLAKGLNDDQIESLQSRYNIAILPHETDPSLHQIMT